MGCLEYVFCNHFGGGVYLQNEIERIKGKNIAATRSWWPASASGKAPTPQMQRLQRLTVSLFKGLHSLEGLDQRRVFHDLGLLALRGEATSLIISLGPGGSIASRWPVAFKGVTASGRDFVAFALTGGRGSHNCVANVA